MNGAIFTYFVLPVLIGAAFRSMLLKWKKGYLLSGVFVLISITAWLWTGHLVDHGTDGTLLLWAVMASELAVGSMISGGIALLLQTAKNRKTDTRF